MTVRDFYTLVMGGVPEKGFVSTAVESLALELSDDSDFVQYLKEVTSRRGQPLVIKIAYRRINNQTVECATSLYFPAVDAPLTAERRMSVTSWYEVPASVRARFIREGPEPKKYLISDDVDMPLEST